ncbi:hypothetical protein SPRG_00195 [Saprolegnia parasitica CBS 223.65]|uniref:RNase III domain-containing protein n=1 Tax=Saprolegnia parasitica (strain CBS 223.65) TaxID=695850 RepID=A0A067D9L2_SAPPC|nr:hypothetical protein SPRG_00195 [Saprolegnia parasitica CBS 223.65]KDO35346.1 hypothetical protein SPRG_00195 [Saprolegnia parasitica CBS 223.65]|eukprot:XP_012193692.1 hypothetical protein SPRG_00195 [Saprolegnia parasitica CBS 223.65]
MSLAEHQREMLALARQQSVVLSGPSRIGKTHVAAMLAREMLDDASSRGQLVLVVVPGTSQIPDVYATMARVCHARMGGQLPTNERAWQTVEYMKAQVASAQVLVLTASMVGLLLQENVLALEKVALLVFKCCEKIHESIPMFYQRLFVKYAKLRKATQPRVVALTTLPISALHLHATKNPLFAYTTACSMTLAATRTNHDLLAPLFAEVFDTTSSSSSSSALVSDPIAFLHGDNEKHVDITAAYLDLHRGIADDASIASRKDRFLNDASAVFTHLGLWCFVQHVLHELAGAVAFASSSHAKSLLASTHLSILSEPMPTIALSSCSISEHAASMAAAVAAATRLHAWLTDLLGSVPLDMATPRLTQVASLYRTFVANESALTDAPLAKRTWIFVHRRTHARVVADYLTASFPRLPPACSMIGQDVAYGSDGVASMGDVMAAFNERRNLVLVTTALTHEMDRVAPCDLVLIADTLHDQHKLLDFRRCADAVVGVARYLVPGTEAEMTKFQALHAKMARLVQMEIANMPHEVLEQRLQAVRAALMPALPDGCHAYAFLRFLFFLFFLFFGNHEVDTLIRRYVVVHDDTQARLDVENSVETLDAFCKTLPGLAIADHRPQYTYTHHVVQASMSVKRRQRLEAGRSLDDDDETPQRVECDAKLRLPPMLGIKETLKSPRVDCEKHAKAIVAFLACQQLLNHGYLDRSFRSRLQRHVSAPSSSSSSASTASVPVETETQSSYEVPATTAIDLGLRSLRDALAATTANSTLTMYLYPLDSLDYGLLTTMPLYGGTVRDTPWRYEFGTTRCILTPALATVRMAHARVLAISRSDLRDYVRYHTTLLRLACYGVAAAEAAIRSSDPLREFSARNDKGYVVVALKKSDGAIDVEHMRGVMGSFLTPAWPLPPPECLADVVCVSKKRKDVTYCIQQVTTTNVGDVAARVVADVDYWSYTIRRAKSAPGNPILGRWYTKDDLLRAEPDQPLVYAIELPSALPIMRHIMDRCPQWTSTLDQKERLILPDQTYILGLSRSRYVQAFGLLPLLYEFERKLQLSRLMDRIGADIDWTLLNDATSKPAYETLETLGDCYLKLESTWFLYERRWDLANEGALHMTRTDIIRNDRLCLKAISLELHKLMTHPSILDTQPFIHWKPSCVGRTPQSLVAPVKWVADTVEAMCGAYIAGLGERGGRLFLSWLGSETLDPVQFAYARPLLPHCTPQPRATLPLSPPPLDLAAHGLQLVASHFDDLGDRLRIVEASLKYEFRNKRLLVEAIAHPSVAPVLRQADARATTTTFKGDYERLEFLGDALIEYLVLTYATTTYPSWQPGDLTNWKGATVSNDALGKTALIALHVDHVMLTGAVKMDPKMTANLRLVKHQFARIRAGMPVEASALDHVSMPKMYADVFEALVAAVFLDAGRDLVTIRDVFLAPLLEIVGADAVATVQRRHKAT